MAALVVRRRTHQGPPDAEDAAGAETRREERYTDKFPDEVEKWMEMLLANLPPPGLKRTEPLVELAKAVRERDIFWLHKLAQEYGVATPFPVAGLKAQLRAGLSSLPIDITGQADELADFIASTQNTLTGEEKQRKAAIRLQCILRGRPARRQAAQLRCAAESRCLASEATAAARQKKREEDWHSSFGSPGMAGVMVFLRDEKRTGCAGAWAASSMLRSLCAACGPGSWPPPP